ncbi:MAG: transporter substrate-binding domain-containing protein [Pseudomonadota bacterium]
MKLTNLTRIAAAAVMVMATGFASADALRVGVEGAYPPFSWKEADGTLKGFDIDFAEEVCKRLNKECVLVEQEWDGMIPALLAKKFDTIIASMSITEERKKKVDFTVKYYNTPAMLVVEKGSGIDGSANSLSGKRVGVQRATTHQCSAEKLYPGAELVLYSTQEEVFQDLAAGRLDAQLSDSLQAQEGFLTRPAGSLFEFVGGAIDDVECQGSGAGFAVRKEDSALRDMLSQAIQDIRADGTYKSMNDKYFPVDIYGN